MDLVTVQSLHQPIARLRPFFDVLAVELDKCPVSFAIAAPSPLLLARHPCFPRAAMPMAGRVANGRGLTRATCIASALGEAVELTSCCAWGDETLVQSSLAKLGTQALDPARLLGLSEDQIAARVAWNDTWWSFDWRPPPVAPDRVIDWVELEWAYGDKTAFAPADFVFIGRRAAGDELAVAIGDSNGCAAGVSKEEARLAALLEMIERDAMARWWYGRRPRQHHPLDSLPLDARLAQYLAERDRRTYLVDVATDLRVPAFAAVSCEKWYRYLYRIECCVDDRSGGRSGADRIAADGS